MLRQKKGILHCWPADGSASPVFDKRKKMCLVFFFFSYLAALQWFSCELQELCAY